MTSRLRKNIKILFERIKAPRRLIRFTLHAVGLYKQGLRNAHALQLQRYEVSFANLPSAFHGYTLLVMSDLHIDSELHLTPKVKKLVEATPADALLLLGDYRYRLTGSYELALQRVKNILKTAHVKDGMYAVRGNHDSKEMMSFFPEFGVHVLNNEAVKITRNSESIYIVGVDEPHYDKEENLPLAMSNVPPETFVILLVHTSEIYRQAASCGVNFYLCGHTHGGQIRFKKCGPIITNTHAPRRFVRGFWDYEGMTGYTSTGVGVSVVPVRFDCSPEIVLFTLRSGPHVAD